MIKTYHELIQLKSFQERFEYLRIWNPVGAPTFGFDRYLNQAFYRSGQWKQVRNKIIVRDEGWDLGIEGYPCGRRPRVHHINPITLEQVEAGDPIIFDPDNLILCSYDTHEQIHFGTGENPRPGPIERRPNDTCPWKV